MRRVVYLQFTLMMITLSAASSSLGAPSAQLWPLWEAHNPQANIEPDHSPWQALLRATVVQLADGRTGVQYSAYDSARRTQLRQYLEQMAQLDPRQFNRATQMAYWINLYNALTVQVVLDHPGKNSILRMGGGWLPRGPWDNTVITVAAQPLTLNDIEHRILRPIWQDHRIHFAVNCASIGCPNLAADAYDPKQLEAQLNAAEASFLGHPRGLRLEDGRLILSSIFDWYMSDFAADRSGLLNYLASVRTDLAPQLRRYQGNIKFEYDWSLNVAPATAP